MTKPQVGDTVRIKDTHPSMAGKIGKIIDIDERLPFPYLVEFSQYSQEYSFKRRSFIFPARKTAIYKAQITTPFGVFWMAVDSTEHDARSDFYSAAKVAFNVYIGLVRIGKIKKSNRRIVAKMTPVKKCDWAWTGEKIR